MVSASATVRVSKRSGDYHQCVNQLKMKRIDIAGSVFLDDGNDVLT
jgi:hypothetical protein